MTHVWTRRAAVMSAAVPLRVRTRFGRGTAARNLRLLERGLIYKGWHCLRLYAPAAGPLMWVYAGSGAREVGTLVTVRAAADGGWWFYRSPDGRGRGVRLASCGDAAAAAERLDVHLKSRLYPGTFPRVPGHGETWS
ncbi:hypothetical protein [Actinomadura sp. WMMB 499]|uniref:hypothetical protein n=1 Tax=Actinomadura sp. WMMB 499 TaxID=1219491 RepID=UPI0012492DE5|nr:hypothetical protein [Actinomadura sp. WMMB 499]QFG24526.1 hypothetical protein F7P10_28745 [Actinomadura sp. WMMB 499]